MVRSPSAMERRHLQGRLEELSVLIPGPEQRHHHRERRRCANQGHGKRARVGRDVEFDPGVELYLARPEAHVELLRRGRSCDRTAGAIEPVPGESEPPSAIRQPYTPLAPDRNGAAHHAEVQGQSHCALCIGSDRRLGTESFKRRSCTKLKATPALKTADVQYHRGDAGVWDGGPVGRSREEWDEHPIHRRQRHRQARPGIALRAVYGLGLPAALHHSHAAAYLWRSSSDRSSKAYDVPAGH